MTIHLLCGDALEQLRLLADESVDLIFTDPPYGHNNNNNDLIHRREAALGLVRKVPDEAARPIANDGVEANDLVRGLFTEAARLLKPGCYCCCCCCGGGPDPQFARWSLWLADALAFKQMVVWDKGPMGMGWHYRRSYETVLVAMRPGAACKWYDTTRKVENIIRPGGLRPAKILPRADQHPTQKPVALAGHFIALHSQMGDLVLDPFMGTGSTGIAAEISGRDFIGIDLNPEYVEMARRRIEGTAPLFAEVGP